MTTKLHAIHGSLPSGFIRADLLQQEQFHETGSIHGASKVCVFRDRDGTLEVATRLRPLRRWSDLMSRLPRQEGDRSLSQSGEVRRISWYVTEYNRGWAAAGRPGVSREWDGGYSTHAFDDGYLDRAAGRMKWHLTYCSNHDECGEG